jgi:periplasmic divalent cation tolerance protein
LKNSFIVVLVTVGSKEEAEKISLQLLEEKLIACANVVGPVTSHFQWLGKIDRAEEFLVFLKSRIDLFDALSEKIKSLHSYEVPEILALPVVAGSKNYLSWLGDSLKKSN